MTLKEAIRSALSLRKDARDTCFDCADFCSDPVQIEQALPGLSAMSSAHASVRAQDGLCVRYQLVLNGRRRCDAYNANAA